MKLKHPTKNKGIDERTIVCSCDNPNCHESGISFDGNILRFHFLEEKQNGDGYTQACKHMILDKETTLELIETLKEILETEFTETSEKNEIPKAIDKKEEEVNKPFLLKYSRTINDINELETGTFLVYEKTFEKAKEKFKRIYWFFENLYIETATIE